MDCKICDFVYDNIWLQLIYGAKHLFKIGQNF